MQSLWRDEEAAAHAGELGLRVYTSRLLGRDRTLVLHGGGNTSVKIDETDRFGERRRVLYVKGSGWDLETIEARGLRAGSPRSCSPARHPRTTFGSRDGHELVTSMLTHGVPGTFGGDHSARAAMPLSLRRSYPCRCGAGGDEHAVRRVASRRLLRRRRADRAVPHARIRSRPVRGARVRAPGRRRAPSAWC